MSRNNDVCKVIFTPITDGQVVVDTRIGDLAPGRWGIFNYDTGKAVHIAAADEVPNNWIYAQMADDGTNIVGTPGEIYTSTGTHIQTKNLRYATEDTGQDAVGQEIKFSVFNIQSGPDATQYDYGIKFDLRGNTEVYQRFGMNQATKFFMASTRCVGKEGGTPAIYADAEVVAQWAEGIYNDVDKFLGFHVIGTGGDVKYWLDPATNKWTFVGAADIADALEKIRLITAGIEITVIVADFSKMQYFCNVNPKYFKQRQIKAIPSLIGGSCAWATIEETKAMEYESGYGYDIKELEYLAGGFTGKPGPYRQSRLHGLAFSDVEFLAVDKTKYDVLVLGYDQFSVGGWLEYLNNQSTYFVSLDAGTDSELAAALGFILDAAGITKILT